MKASIFYPHLCLYQLLVSVSTVNLAEFIVILLSIENKETFYKSYFKEQSIEIVESHYIETISPSSSEITSTVSLELSIMASEIVPSEALISWESASVSRIP